MEYEWPPKMFPIWTCETVEEGSCLNRYTMRCRLKSGDIWGIGWVVSKMEATWFRGNLYVLKLEHAISDLYSSVEGASAGAGDRSGL